MKGTQRRLPIVEIVVAVVAIALIAGTSYYEEHRREAGGPGYDTFSTYDASSGGYRAWFELLQREHVRVERYELRPALLDNSVDVYVSAFNLNDAIAQMNHGIEPQFWSGGDSNAVATWVRAGGRFIWLSDVRMPPLEFMNAPIISVVGPQKDEAVVVAPSALAAGVRYVSGTSKLRVPFRVADAAPIVADDTGSVVVTYPLGKGEVVIVTDESLFTNGRIGSADNATLAYDLAVAGLTPHGAVAFDEWSHGYVAGDSWWSILPKPVQVALIVIAVALLLLAVGTGLRFGPTARLPDESERTSAEYLTSMAVLLQRGRAIKAALVDMADSCLREVAAALGISEAAPARAIAARAGVDDDDERAQDVMELDRLRSYEYPHEAELLRAAQLCAALRKEFSTHARIGIGRRTTSARRTA